MGLHSGRYERGRSDALTVDTCVKGKLYVEALRNPLRQQPHLRTMECGDKLNDLGPIV